MEASVLMVILHLSGPQSNEVKTCIHSWKEKMDVVKKLLTLLNSYTPPEIRSMSIGRWMFLKGVWVVEWLGALILKY